MGAKARLYFVIESNVFLHIETQNPQTTNLQCILPKSCHQWLKCVRLGGILSFSEVSHACKQPLLMDFYMPMLKKMGFFFLV